MKKEESALRLKKCLFVPKPKSTPATAMASIMNDQASDVVWIKENKSDTAVSGSVDCDGAHDDVVDTQQPTQDTSNAGLQMTIKEKAMVLFDDKGKGKGEEGGESPHADTGVSLSIWVNMLLSLENS